MSDQRVRLTLETGDLEQATTRSEQRLDDVAKAADRTSDKVSGLTRIEKKLRDERGRFLRQGTDVANNLDRGAAAADRKGRAMGRLDRIIERANRTWADHAKAAAGALAIYLSIASAASGINRSIGDFGAIETSLVGVAKVTSLTREEMAGLRGDVESLSVSTSGIPRAANDLLDLGAAAGQLGVDGRADILAYVEAIGALGDVSDLEGPEAAKVLTRILNVQGEAPAEIRRLASVIVELGNNSAATEREIADIATSIALSTSAFRLGSTTVAGYAAATAESGLQAQLTGSAIGRTLREIQGAVSAGGTQLEQFAAIAKTSSEDFVALWEQDANAAFLSFLEGLRDHGQEAGVVLEGLGLGGDELAKVLPTLATNYDKLAEKLRLANAEAETQGALAREAKAAYDTQAADLSRLANAAQLYRSSLGEGLSPQLRESARELTAELAANRDQAEALGQSLGRLVDVGASAMVLLVRHADTLQAALGGLVAIKIGGWVQAAMVAAGGLASTLGRVAAVVAAGKGSLLLSLTALNPVAIALAGTFAVLGYALVRYSQEQREEAERTETLNAALGRQERYRLDVAAATREQAAAEEQLARFNSRTEAGQQAAVSLQDYNTISDAVVAAREEIERLEEASRRAGSEYQAAAAAMASAALPAARANLERLTTAQEDAYYASLSLTEAARLEAAMRGETARVLAEIAEEEREVTAAKEKAARVSEDVAKKIRSTNAELREQIEVERLRLDAIGEGEEAEQELARALEIRGAVAKVTAQAASEGIVVDERLLRVTRDLAGELADLKDESTKLRREMDASARSTEAWANSMSSLARAQREHAALAKATPGNIEATQVAIERARVAEEAYAQAVESGNVEMVAGHQVLTERGAQMVNAALATFDLDQLTRLLTAGLVEQADIELRVIESRTDRAAAEQELLIRLTQGEEAARKYRLELEALAAAGIDRTFVGPPTAAQQEIYDNTIATGEVRDALGDLENDAKATAERTADAWATLLGDAISSSADGWQDWERLAMQAVRAVAEYQQRQQVSAQASASGGGQSSTARASSAASSYSSGLQAAAIVIAAYEAAGDRMDDRRGRRIGTSFVVGGAQRGGAIEPYQRISRDQRAELGSDAAAQLMDGIAETLFTLVDSMGVTFDALAGMGVQISNNGERIIVSVGEWEQSFEDLGTAISTGMAQVLAQTEFEGLSDNLRNAIETAAERGSKLAEGELQEIINRAITLDQAGMTESERQLRRISTSFAGRVREARELGLSIEDLFTELRTEVEEVVDRVTGLFESIIPGSGLLDQVRSFHAAVAESEGVAAGLAVLEQATTAVIAREQELADLREHQANNPDANGPGAPWAGGGNGGNFFNQNEETDPWSIGWGGWTDAHPTGPGPNVFAEAGEAIGQVSTVAGKALGVVSEGITEVSIASERYVDALPDPVDLELIANAQRALSATIEQTLGENILSYIEDANIRQRVEEANHTLRMFELEQQYAALVLMGTVSADVLAIYRAAIDDIGAEGPTSEGRGGGGGRGRQRAEDREGVDARIEELRQRQDGLSVARELIEGWWDLIREMGRLGASQDQIREAVELERQAAIDDRLQPFRDRTAEIERPEGAAGEMEVLNERYEAERRVLEALGASSEQMEELVRWREAEIEVLNRQFDTRREDFGRRASGESDYDAELRAIHEEAAQLIADAEALGRSEAELAAIRADEILLIERLNEATTAGFLDNLLGFVDRYHGKIEGVEDLRLGMEQARWAIELANLTTQFELVKGLGYLTEEQVNFVDGILAAARGQGPPGAGTDPEVQREVTNLGTQWEAQRRQIRATRESLQALERDLEDGVIGLGRFNRAVGAFNTEQLINFGQQLFAFVDRYYKGEQKFTAERQALSNLTWAYELSQLELQFEFVKTLGILTDEQLAAVGGILGEMRAAGPPLLDVANGVGALNRAATDFITTIGGVSTDDLRAIWDQLQDLLTGHATGVAADLAAARAGVAEIGDLSQQLRSAHPALLRELAQDLGMTVQELLASLPTQAELAALEATAIGRVVDGILGPIEDLGRNPITTNLAAQIVQLRELMAVAEEYGLDQERILRAQATLFEEAWRQVTEPLRGALDSIRADDPGLDSRERLTDLQAQMADAVARFRAGDLDASGEIARLAREINPLAQQLLSPAAYGGFRAELEALLSGLLGESDILAGQVDPLVAAAESSLTTQQSMLTELAGMHAILGHIAGGDGNIESVYAMEARLARVSDLGSPSGPVRTDGATSAPYVPVAPTVSVTVPAPTVVTQPATSLEAQMLEQLRQLVALQTQEVQMMRAPRVSTTRTPRRPA